MDDIFKQIIAIDAQTYDSNGISFETLQSLYSTFPDGLIVEKQGEEVIGFLGWERQTFEVFPPYNHTFTKSHKECGLLAYISFITVADEHRGKGIGTKLLNELDLRVKKHHCHTIYIPIQKDHPDTEKGLLDFWKKNGYEQTGETIWERNPGSPSESYVYKKLL